ncbi:hypothetical protein VB834_17350 [Limnoraphis robusta Tam1]|uniref:GIY-YIG domain-containing protein n=1 Tax=Limnoraphis robusta CCNP1315 TaxID=3110306 RepID=A0ABU5TYI4_9CYAN|nr:hypothetical protein [Limnoraphis robusta]MEA5495979.1 hypothetical protein [Limnoraphis robusta BA-68 BA1]MEA5520006.1 hypothetical protein [Limnoraphis robusta CCNP1315]MEA5540789.1 hypothetical protein [Limnoraphis robusta Tam1]MEA5544887.1 hypothetical protein [Limnoraphis robusta CCNP1324]
MGKRFRGGKSNQYSDNHKPGIAPVGTILDEPCSPNWCGHQWSEWYPLSEAQNYLTPDALGLYRIRMENQSKLVYIGQGRIQARLQNHARKLQQFNSRLVIGSASDATASITTLLECAWISNNTWLENQRLELENDLIGSHLLITETIPLKQFGS